MGGHVFDSFVPVSDALEATNVVHVYEAMPQLPVAPADVDASRSDFEMLIRPHIASVDPIVVLLNWPADR